MASRPSFEERGAQGETKKLKKRGPERNALGHVMPSVAIFDTTKHAGEHWLAHPRTGEETVAPEFYNC